MKNRTNDQASTAKQNINHSTKSVPSLKAVMAWLLTGKPLHHTDWTKTHGGEQHRLGIAIHQLRHKYNFGKRIQCPKEKNHPLQYHYFVAPSDMAEVESIAKYHGFI